MRIIKTRMQYPDYSEPDPIEARPTTVRTIAIALVATIAATALMVAALTSDSWAHEAPSGWMYSAACCASYDCAEIPDDAVREGPDGYEINLHPGQHPMVKSKVYRVIVPYDSRKLRDSPDGKYHACILGTGRFQCLYRGARGF